MVEGEVLEAQFILLLEHSLELAQLHLMVVRVLDQLIRVAVEQEEELLFIIQPRLIVVLIRLMEEQATRMQEQELFI